MKEPVSKLRLRVQWSQEEGASDIILSSFLPVGRACPCHPG